MTAVFRREQFLKIQGGSHRTISLTPDRLLCSFWLALNLQHSWMMPKTFRRYSSSQGWFEFQTLFSSHFNYASELSRRRNAQIPTTRTTSKAITISLRKVYILNKNCYRSYSFLWTQYLLSKVKTTFSSLMPRKLEFLQLLLTVLHAAFILHTVWWHDRWSKSFLCRHDYC